MVAHPLPPQQGMPDPYHAALPHRPQPAAGVLPPPPHGIMPGPPGLLPMVTSIAFIMYVEVWVPLKVAEVSRDNRVKNKSCRDNNRPRADLQTLERTKMHPTSQATGFCGVFRAILSLSPGSPIFSTPGTWNHMNNIINMNMATKAARLQMRTIKYHRKGCLATVS